MNKITEKLIKDGSETRRVKMNMISIIIGVVLLCIGFACLALKGLTVQYIGQSGFLHENFFLLPIGFLFIFSSFIIFFIIGIKNIINLIV